MGLFDRKEKQVVLPTRGLASPIVVRDGDIALVDRLLQDFEAAVGTDGPLRSFGVAFNRAGGFVSDMDTLDAVRLVAEATKRPWYWIGAVSEAALAEGDCLLPAKVGVMAQFWNSQIAPLLGPADWFDGIVDSISPRAAAQIYAAALLGACHLEPDAVLMSNPTGTVQAGPALLLLSTEVLKVEEHSPTDAVAYARQVLGR